VTTDQDARSERAEAKRRLVQGLLRECNRARHEGRLTAEEIAAELRTLADGYAEGAD
jgi:hypothetical protein